MNCLLFPCPFQRERWEKHISDQKAPKIKTRIKIENPKHFLNHLHPLLWILTIPFYSTARCHCKLSPKKPVPSQSAKTNPCFPKENIATAQRPPRAHISAQAASTGRSCSTRSPFPGSGEELMSRNFSHRKFWWGITRCQAFIKKNIFLQKKETFSLWRPRKGTAPCFPA